MRELAQNLFIKNTSILQEMIFNPHECQNCFTRLLVCTVSTVGHEYGLSRVLDYFLHSTFYGGCEGFQIIVVAVAENNLM